MCILVVEDDRTLGRVYMHHLDQLGYQADLASTRAEAIAFLQTKVYGLILMDIALPDGDGLGTTKEIRRLNSVATGQVPIVAVTSGHSNKAECLKAGMNDYFVKPVLLQQIMDILVKWNPTRCH